MLESLIGDAIGFSMVAACVYGYVSAFIDWRERSSRRRP